MPRKPALQVAELPVHIIQRGNNRQECFFAGERDSGEGEPGRGEPGRGLHNWCARRSWRNLAGGSPVGVSSSQTPRNESCERTGNGKLEA